MKLLFFDNLSCRLYHNKMLWRTVWHFFNNIKNWNLDWKIAMCNSALIGIVLLHTHYLWDDYSADLDQKVYNRFQKYCVDCLLETLCWLSILIFCLDFFTCQYIQYMFSYLTVGVAMKIIWEAFDLKIFVYECTVWLFACKKFLVRELSVTF